MRVWRFGGTARLRQAVISANRSGFGRPDDRLLRVSSTPQLFDSSTGALEYSVAGQAGR
jgi:hypothetical protein